MRKLCVKLVSNLFVQVSQTCDGVSTELTKKGVFTTIGRTSTMFYGFFQTSIHEIVHRKNIGFNRLGFVVFHPIHSAYNNQLKGEN